MEVERSQALIEVRLSEHTVSRNAIPAIDKVDNDDYQGDADDIRDGIRELVWHKVYYDEENAPDGSQEPNEGFHSTQPNLYKMSGGAVSLENYDVVQTKDKYGNLVSDHDGLPLYSDVATPDLPKYKFEPQHQIYDPDKAAGKMDKWQKLVFGRQSKGGSGVDAILSTGVYEGVAIERVADNPGFLKAKTVLDTQLPEEVEYVASMKDDREVNGEIEEHTDLYTISIEVTKESSNPSEDDGLILTFEEFYNEGADKFNQDDNSANSLKASVKISVSHEEEEGDTRTYTDGGPGGGGGGWGGWGGGGPGGPGSGTGEDEEDDKKPSVSPTTITMSIGDTRTINYQFSGDRYPGLDEEDPDYDIKSLGSSPAAFTSQLDPHIGGEPISEGELDYSESFSISIKGLYPSVYQGDSGMRNTSEDEDQGTSLDELAPQTRKLLEQICELAKKKCKEGQIEQRDLRLSRRDIRNFTGLSDTRLRIHLQRLVEMEYLHLARGSQGKTCVYELLYKGEGQQGKPFVMSLIDTNTIQTSQGKNSTSQVPRTPFAATSPMAEFDVNDLIQAGNK